MFKGLSYVYCNVDDGSNGVGGGGSSEQTPNNDTPQEGQQSQNVEPSLLASAKIEPININQNENALSFPEKYTVKNEDGTVNIEESTKKLVEGYGNLAKKMGQTGGIVPDTADGYKIEFDPQELGLPEDVTADVLKGDPEFKKFVDKAHKAGFTNEQINLVSGEYLQAVQSVIDRKFEDDAKATKTALMETWKTPAEFDQNLSNAKKAFDFFASDEDKALIDEIGNNPLALRLLANVGAKMREDSPVRNSQPTESRETIRELMMSEAYQDPKNPEHARVYRQVSEYYRQAVGDDSID